MRLVVRCLPGSYECVASLCCEVQLLLLLC